MSGWDCLGKIGAFTHACKYLHVYYSNCTGYVCSSVTTCGTRHQTIWPYMGRGCMLLKDSIAGCVNEFITELCLKLRYGDIPGMFPKIYYF